MVKSIGIEEAEQLVAGGAQLVEVLPEEDYEFEHIAGAMNLPLKKLHAVSAGKLNRSRPIVVYCNDAL